MRNSGLYCQSKFGWRSVREVPGFRFSKWSLIISAIGAKVGMSFLRT